jgi:hypothetical protein
MQRGFREPVAGSAVAVAAAMLLSGCGGGASTEDSKPEAQTATASPSAVASPSPAAPELLVGTWQRVTECAELVQAFKQAGLGKVAPDAVAGNGFVPGVASADQLANPSNPCEGSVPREHSHFFTEDGLFGSLDWNGEQVDDGTYEIIDDNTFVISKEFPDVTFNYRIQGDTIMFDPVIPDCSPGCFEAQWSVSVAYPGKTWERVS